MDVVAYLHRNRQTVRNITVSCPQEVDTQRPEGGDIGVAFVRQPL